MDCCGSLNQPFGGGSLRSSFFVLLLNLLCSLLSKSPKSVRGAFVVGKEGVQRCRRVKTEDRRQHLINLDANQKALTDDCRYEFY